MIVKLDLLAKLLFRNMGACLTKGVLRTKVVTVLFPSAFSGPTLIIYPFRRNVTRG